MRPVPRRTDTGTDATDGGVSDDPPGDSSDLNTTTPPPTDSDDGDSGDTGSEDTDDGTDEGTDEEASLSIEADASPQVIEQGDTVTMIIVVANAGPGSDPGVTVNAMLPDGFVLQGSVPGYDTSTGVWDIGEMQAGDTATLTLVVEVMSEPDEVVTSPTVSGESTDSLPLDDEACTMVEVQPATPSTEGSEGGTDGSTSGAPDGEPTQSGTEITHEDGDSDATGDDTTVDGDSTPPPSDSGSESTAPPAGTESTDDGDDAGDPSASASSGGTSTQTDASSDVGFDPTRSDSALLMLGWMLLAAGCVLLLMGRLRRRKMMGWSPDR